jgi:glycosyltransferase involved in cell wall biosynthesis
LNAGTRTAVVVVPGSLETRTGGYVYDKRIVSGLRALGWTVHVHELDGRLPLAGAAMRDGAAAVLRSIARGSLVIIDGLALGVMPDEVQQAGSGLRLVGLVHHPLAAETGLDVVTRMALETSERRSLALMQHIIVTSRATAGALRWYGVEPPRVSVVVPGVDRVPLAHGSSDGIVELLCVASLTPRKGHEVLFRALAPLAGGPWHLTCVGSPDMDPVLPARLQTLLRELGLAQQVELAGEADAAAVAAHYARSDVFVLPTLYEGYGMAVAEALAHGLPVISTPTGGIADLVGDAAGVLVPAGDVNALADALCRVIGDHALRHRLAAGAARVRGSLGTWDDAARAFADILAMQVTG